MKVCAINRHFGFLTLSFAILLFSSVHAEESPEMTALVDRAVIENLMVDYYSHIGDSSFDFSQYFVSDGVLDVNGIVAGSAEEIKALYIRASGGAVAAKPAQDPDAPPPSMFNMLLSNLKVEVTGDNATAEMFWTSVESETLISPPSVTEYGRERTSLVKQNGKWFIKHRIVTSGGGMPRGELNEYLNKKR